MSEDDLGQTVRFREFVTSRDELRARLHAIELEQARLSASLMHLPMKVDELVASVNALSQQVVQRNTQQQEPDHAALALHRAIDNMQRQGGGAIERWLMLALIGGAGWMAARFFIGG